MDICAPSLFKTPLRLCCVYLDPLIIFKITNTQKSTAAMALIKVHERIIKTEHLDKWHRANDTLDEIPIRISSLEQMATEQFKPFKEISVYSNEKPYDKRAP